MISQNLIERGGSKLEITRALLEGEVDIPIPYSTWKYYGQSLDSILSEVQKMPTPWIVRGSHRNDYHGLIDIVPTVRGISTLSGLENAVKLIEGETASQDFKAHCEDWKQPYTPEVHILIQSQSKSPIVGSMLRHPHDRKQLRIECNELGDKSGVSHSKIGIFGDFHPNSHLKIGDDEIKKLIEMYEKLENSGVIDAEWAHQVEFGLGPLMFYQARPFKKFQPATKNLDYDFLDSLPHIRSEESFGIAPKEGIDVTFVVRDIPNLLGSSLTMDLPISEQYGLIVMGASRNSPPTGKKFGNLFVFCSSCHDFSYLFHGNYRLMKKADYSLIDIAVKKEGNLNFKPFYETVDLSDFKDSKFFSDGRSGFIIPKKYLA